MGQLTALELANVANAALDFYMKGPALSQRIEQKPALKAFKAAQKTFPGGKQFIRGNVKGDYTTQFMGYSFDDSVGYSNPANMKQFQYAWYEIHAGIGLTFTELKMDGITVVDSLSGEKTSNHSDRDITVLSGLLEDKLEDMGEGSTQSFNSMLWKDGTQDPKVFPGIQFVVADAPTTGLMAGLDRASFSWWRNRAKTGTTKITASTASQTLTKTLRAEVRQLRRYGGNPSLVFAGSTFIQSLEAEIHEKGTYTQEGFINRGKVDIGMADIAMRGVGTIQYEPQLDDLGRADYAYFFDPKHIFLDVMDGEDMKQHSPARPSDKYVLYRGVTWTGGFVANKLNCHGVYQTSSI